jgi:hypothetical protein
MNDNKWVTSKLHQLIGHMHDVAWLDGKRKAKHKSTAIPNVLDGFEQPPVIEWAKQTWEVYTTEHGARVILKSQPFPLDDRQNRSAFRASAQFLSADPIYTHKCIEQQCYRARLTPKAKEDCQPVCCSTNLQLWTISNPHPDIAAQYALHAEVTLMHGSWTLHANFDDDKCEAEAENLIGVAEDNLTGV